MTEQLVQSGRLQEKFCAQMPLIGDKAPAFEAETTKGMIRFPDDYAGKWVILFSHPADFTPVYVRIVYVCQDDGGIPGDGCGTGRIIG